MSLVLNVEILGEFKNLTAATKGAQNQLTSMNQKAAKVSKAITGAFAAIGIGLSFRAIANELEEASKAAIEDVKSQKLLALAMQNTAKATTEQIAAAEKSINKMQFQSGVADDKLRPAFQKLFIATKDVTQSNRLLQIALDASAATGKGLDAVSQAMAKSLAGSDTALVKLIPSLKGAKDPMAELEKTFKGAAAEAANLDPYQKMQVIFGEMQEKIGTALLPTLNKFSTWLSTPEGTAKLQAIVDFIVLIINKFGELVKFVIANKDWLVPVVAAIGTLTTAWKGVETTIGVVRTVQALFATESVVAAGKANIALAGVALTIAGIVAGIAIVSDWAGKTLQTDTAASKEVIGGAFSLNSTAPISTGGSNMSFTKPKATTTKSTTIVNNIKATQSAAQISATLNKQLKSSGSSTIIRGGR